MNLKLRSISNNYNYINCDKYNSEVRIMHQVLIINWYILYYILVEFNIYNINNN